MILVPFAAIFPVLWSRRTARLDLRADRLLDSLKE
jgi:hypothetical protein